jgi:ribosome-associated protein
MIEIKPGIAINENDLTFDFIRSSGPGGQNVNKVATGVQLRYDLTAAETLPEEVKRRLHSIARKRITDEGILIIEAKRYRSQEQNRADAIARLAALVFQATERPKPRKKTQPSMAARQRRLESKRQQSEKKRMRRPAVRSGEDA